jgi:Domain of unknown function (DUF4402)
MGVFRSSALLLPALVAAAAGSSPAGGQCRLCDKPTSILSQSADGDTIQLEIESSLDFGRLILAADGEGAAVIHPDGSSAAQGALAGVSARAMVGTASIHGTAGRVVRVELPRRIDLYSVGGGRITLDEVISDLPPLPRLDSAGNLTFRFGGRVTVTGDSDGDYRGDMPITVEYQ